MGKQQIGSLKVQLPNGRVTQVGVGSGNAVPASGDVTFAELLAADAAVAEGIAQVTELVQRRDSLQAALLSRNAGGVIIDTDASEVINITTRERRPFPNRAPRAT